MNKLQWNRNAELFSHVDAFENIVSEMTSILSRMDELTHGGHDKITVILHTISSHRDLSVPVVY